MLPLKMCDQKDVLLALAGLVLLTEEFLFPVMCVVFPGTPS